MQLKTALDMQAPIIWVTTEEHARVHAEIVSHLSKQDHKKSLLYLDGVEGLTGYDYTEEAWKVLLHPNADEPITAMADVFKAARLESSVLILDHAHLMVENLYGYLTSLFNHYRESINDNSNFRSPPSMVLVSNEDEVPNEIARYTIKTELELPSQENLVHTLKDLSTDLPREKAAQVARAGAGLSEFEFITSIVSSIKEEGEISSDFVARKKIETLQGAGVIDIRRPAVSLSDLGGLDKAKEMFEAISWVWRNPEQASNFGVDPVRKVLLVGVPGSGKSLVCEAVANSLGLDLGKGGISSSMSKWVGESEKQMRKTFSTLKVLAPIVFWIDEFGRDMSTSNGLGGDGGTTDRVQGEFLTGLQELPQNVFLLGAANNIADLPPEMTRAERFDRIMFVGLPTEEERKEIFDIHLKEVQNEVDSATVAKETRFFTGAEIKSLIKNTIFDISVYQKRPITTKDLVEAIPNVKGRIWISHRDSLKAMYEKALSEWYWASSSQFEEAQEVMKELRKKPSSSSSKQDVPTFRPRNLSTRSTGNADNG